MATLISVIVPVYNVEKYLKKCVDSILAQSYKNLEIILVDDGSRDASLSICREYEALDSRIRVIHKENGGLSSARNAGLDIMSGSYVSFVDSDDYLEPDAILNMYNAITESGADIAYMQSYFVNADYSIRGNTNTTSGQALVVYSSSEYVSEMCKKKKSESVCDKLFSTSLFEGARFASGRLNEDFFFLSRLLFLDLKIAAISYAGYNYYQRAGSITNSGFSKSIVDAVKNSYELKKIAHEEKPSLVLPFAEITLFQARTALLTMPWDYIKTKSDEYKAILSAVHDCLPYLSKTELSKSDRLFLKAVAKFPRFILRFTTILWNIKAKKR